MSDALKKLQEWGRENLTDEDRKRIDEWAGPCRHGRSPVDRCRKCGDPEYEALRRVAEAARGMAKLEGCDLRDPEFKDAWLAIYYALAALDDPKEPKP